jgi:hypothetical protein
VRDRAATAMVALYAAEAGRRTARQERDRWRPLQDDDAPSSASMRSRRVDPTDD